MNGLMKQRVNQEQLSMGTRGEQHQPAISIVDDRGEELTQYFLPEGSYVERSRKATC